jgi:hypothetical protein
MRPRNQPVTTFSFPRIDDENFYPSFHTKMFEIQLLRI